jgi:hypothetical protein
MDATKVKRGLGHSSFETAYAGQLDVHERDRVAKQPPPSSNERSVSDAGQVIASATSDWEVIETILSISFEGEVVR